MVEKLQSAVDGPMQHNHVPNNVNYNSLDRSSMSRNVPVRENHLESKQFAPSNAEPPPFMRSNNSSQRNSVQRERPKRFTELLDSTVVNDHFDQYGTISSQCSETGSYYGAVPPHEDSGLGGLTPDEYSPGYSDHDGHVRSMNGAQEPMTPMSPPIPLPIVQNQNKQQQHQMPPYQQQMSQHHYPSQQHLQQQQQMQMQPQNAQPPKPGTPVDEPYSATARPLSRPLQRRKTLPSIMTRPPTIGESSKGAQAKSPSSSAAPVAPSTPKEEETYIIENGVRKRIKAEVYKTPPSPSPSTKDDDKPKQLPKRYKIEASSNLRRIPNRGSLPDVSTCQELKDKVVPREQMSKLSEARRQELMILQEEEERRRQQEIVLRFTDLKVSVAISKLHIVIRL